MGYTKTVCCNVRPERPRAQDWVESEKQRADLIQTLRAYLNDDPCVAGASKSIVDVNPHVDLLAKAYMALVKEEILGHKSRVSGMRCMRTTALVFSDMWRIPATLESKLLENDDVLDVSHKRADTATDTTLLKKLINSYSKVKIEKGPTQQVYEAAEVLAESYARAFSEFQAALQNNDISVVYHHASLIADLIEQMHSLLNYTKQKSDKDYTEFALPESHPHSRR